MNIYPSDYDDDRPEAPWNDAAQAAADREWSEHLDAIGDPAAERIDEHLDEQDAAADWTPETVYDPRPFRLWWHGKMTYQEYQAHKARIAAMREEWNRRQDEYVFRLMAEMGW
ncbi:hypothetical protein [Candidatus Promineifilum breve]|nr:hypothetical protein [Candidatus Promineifilum breve]